jgi:hypothetical protein
MRLDFTAEPEDMIGNHGKERTFRETRTGGTSRDSQPRTFGKSHAMRSTVILFFFDEIMIFQSLGP